MSKSSVTLCFYQIINGFLKLSTLQCVERSWKVLLSSGQYHKNWIRSDTKKQWTDHLAHHDKSWWVATLFGLTDLFTSLLLNRLKVSHVSISKTMIKQQI